MADFSKTVGTADDANASDGHFCYLGDYAEFYPRLGIEILSLLNDARLCAPSYVEANVSLNEIGARVRNIDATITDMQMKAVLRDLLREKLIRENSIGRLRRYELTREGEEYFKSIPPGSGLLRDHERREMHEMRGCSKPLRRSPDIIDNIFEMLMLDVEHYKNSDSVERTICIRRLIDVLSDPELKKELLQECIVEVHDDAIILDSKLRQILFGIYTLQRRDILITPEDYLTDPANLQCYGILSGAGIVKIPDEGDPNKQEEDEINMSKLRHAFDELVRYNLIQKVPYCSDYGEIKIGFCVKDPLYVHWTMDVNDVYDHILALDTPVTFTQLAKEFNFKREYIKRIVKAIVGAFERVRFGDPVPFTVVPVMNSNSEWAIVKKTRTSKTKD